ncbi:MAG: ABC transporter permease, partial [Actinomycetota bacterium]|nr:ABC transporter permease [Actinomycetota bacterium]
EGRAVGEGRWLWPALAAPGVIWLVLLFLVPFYAVLAVAMGAPDPIFGGALPAWNPLAWDPGEFGTIIDELFTGQLGVVFLRTLFYVAVATFLSLLIGYPVAYYVARHAGRYRVLLLMLIIAPFWINYLMRMLAWVNLLSTDGYVNQVLMLVGVLDAPREWLVGKHETVILGLVYGYVPFLILPLFAALDRIDPRVIEAARDLGASSAQAFWRVTLPLSSQGILAGCVIVMLPMFGDYYTATLLSGSPKTNMVGKLIEQDINTSAGSGRGAALTVVLMAFVGILMTYYLYSVARATREART